VGLGRRWGEMGGDGSRFVQRPGLWSLFARGCLSQASSGHSRCWGRGAVGRRAARVATDSGRVRTFQSTCGCASLTPASVHGSEQNQVACGGLSAPQEAQLKPHIAMHAGVHHQACSRRWAPHCASVHCTARARATHTDLLEHTKHPAKAPRGLARTDFLEERGGRAR